MWWQIELSNTIIFQQYKSAGFFFQLILEDEESDTEEGRGCNFIIRSQSSDELSFYIAPKRNG